MTADNHFHSGAGPMISGCGPIHVISLGAGVQSSCMALMAAHGEITPMPECAIFADTGWEPKRIYDLPGDLERLFLSDNYAAKSRIYQQLADAYAALARVER